MRVNNDVDHWSLACITELQAKCDIIIDPHYHKFPYFRTGHTNINKATFLPFMNI